ncbi:F0F1 ATP synthase subunit B [Nitrosomonas sp.]|uniref:F0F1 ATP synthase subunit B n=1 Tax=Nitrosomonas sp. TaxID=42353 RepID=UPI001D838595|nr:F0F1 ATP synthase subunit B [Nitrosomonas sp.]MCB1947467.1 F0F1 ATP synthase subunit B [Nitrosomonas sp.]MCP5242057.1 F0F1 ATP synthase subunit B [Burkholderiales bacterium]MDR4514253.1 F0F1 ATP synthase subunit B [Nitrosomonas sp.]
MSIDWITVSAQIVNFLILVWLLKRFLYQPVIRAMDRREQQIAAQLDQAQAREQNANEKAQEYQAMAKELERTRNAILSDAHEKAEQQRRQLLDEARQEVTKTRDHWHRQFQQEKEEFLNNMRSQISNTVQNIARKALDDLADAELEEQIITSFINRLSSLDQQSQTLLQKASRESSEPVRITSTFKLDSAARKRLTHAIHAHLIDGAIVEYDESSELLCGIALMAGEGQLSWNLADYIQRLGQDVEKALSPAARPETQKE